MSIRIQIVAAALVFAQALGVSAASAQVIEEIVVTAQKREQAITDVPITISAFTGEDIRGRNITKPQGIAFLVPNVDFKGSAQGETNPAITIRGVGMNNFNSNNNTSVGMYVNGVGLSSTAMMSLNMLDVERIEVLKGPQGTLYGRNSSAGAINIWSAKPTQELDGFAALTAGDYETLRFEGAVGGGFSDSVSGRISLLYDERGESYHTNVTNGSNFGSSETTGIRGQLAYDGDRLSANFSLGWMDNDRVNGPLAAFGLFDAPFSFAPCAAISSGSFDNSTCVDILGYQNGNSSPFEHDYRVVDQNNQRTASDGINAALTLDYDFESVTLTSITGYIEMDRFYGENAWATPNALFAATHDEKIEQFSQELRLAGASGIANWVGGVYYSTDTITAFNNADSADVFGAFFGLSPVLWDYDQETTAWALFGNIDWTLGDNWTLATGLRYTDEEVKFNGQTSAAVLGDPTVIIPLQCPNYDLNTGVCTDPNTTFADDNVSWRAALEWRPNEDLLAYLSASSGFKSGGYNGDFIIDEGGYDPFLSEELIAYELGAKWTTGSGRLLLDGAVFVYDYDNFQTLVPASGGIGFALGNVAKAEVWGVDFGLTSRPIDSLDLRLGLGYVDTTIKDARVTADSVLPNAPEIQVTAGGRWEIPVGSTWAFGLQADIKYSDGSFRTLATDYVGTSGLLTNNPGGWTDSYTVADGSIDFLQPEGNWKFSLWGKNLADEVYFQESFDTFDPLGAAARLAGAPRMYGLTATYFFQ